LRPRAEGRTGFAAHGFDAVVERRGLAGAPRGDAGAHRQGRLRFGAWAVPAAGKDHDRSAHRAFAPPSDDCGGGGGEGPVFGFGLFDGHGLHAGVAELAM
jgi:hypothetical protein